MNVDEKKYAMPIMERTAFAPLVVNLADGRELGAAVSDYPTGDLGIILDPNQPTLARQSPRDYVDCFMVAVREAVNQAKTAESGFEPKDVAGIGRHNWFHAYSRRR